MPMKVTGINYHYDCEWFITDHVIKCQAILKDNNHCDGTIKGVGFKWCIAPTQPTEVFWCSKCADRVFQHNVNWHIPTIEEILLHEHASGKAGAAVPKMKKMDKCFRCGVEFCEICDVCHTEECPLCGKRVVTKSDAIAVKHLLAETQKARGYAVLADKVQVPKPFRIVSDTDEVTDTVKSLIGSKAKGTRPRMFVRPCPERPWHGFVESRPVDMNQDDVDQQIISIMDEAKRQDPKAELLIVPYVDAKYNLVITPTRIAIGDGHDGATAGKGSITLPLTGTAFPEIPPELVKQARVNVDEDDPYLEAVIGKDDLLLFTQLRAGAKIPPAIGKDFIPHDMTVEKVIEASGDLIEWRNQIGEIGRGTVVCHIGGTLISHYGVHCIYNNIPVMTTRKPTIGESIAANSRAVQPNPYEVAKGLAFGAAIRLSRGSSVTSVRCDKAVDAILMVLHNAAAFTEEDGFWIGVSASLMLRVGMAASHGEARHSNPNTRALGRSFVHELSLSDFLGSRRNLGPAQYAFLNRTWSSGYGGKAWAKCTQSIIDLDVAARLLLNDPSKETVSMLVTELNNAVNQAHNGGWWLDKFVSSSVFDQAARQSIYSVCRGAGSILQMRQIGTDEGMQAEIQAAWAQEKDIEVASGKLYAQTPEGKEAAKKVPNDVECIKCKDPECPSCAYLECPCPECSGSDGDNIDDDIIDDPPEDDDVVVQADPYAITGNASGLVPFTDDTIITEAQGRVIGTKAIHIQFRTDKTSGYYSFDVLGVFKHPDGEDLETWSGSGQMEYFSLNVEKAEGGKQAWRFFRSDLDIDVFYNVMSGEAKKL